MRDGHIRGSSQTSLLVQFGSFNSRDQVRGRKNHASRYAVRGTLMEYALVYTRDDTSNWRMFVNFIRARSIMATSFLQNSSQLGAARLLA